MLKVKHETIDKIGFSISFLCGLHCAALPLICLILPFIGLSFLVSNTFEISLIILSFSLGVASICWGVFKHRQCFVLLPLCLGVLSVLVAQLYLKGQIFEAVAMTFGGFFLCISHYINLSACKSCRKCNL